MALISDFIVFVVILACIMACVLARAPAAERRGGGAFRPRPPRADHVVVDLLNVTHWLHHKKNTNARIDAQAVLRTIDATAPLLKKRWPGRVTYVVKDRTHEFNDDKTHELYADAAARNRVVICVAEQYRDPPTSNNRLSRGHSAAGRDDFYMCLLAQRERAVVVTNDRLKDFKDFRRELPPFHVLEFSYVRRLPTRDFIRPESLAYAGLRRPVLVSPAEVFV